MVLVYKAEVVQCKPWSLSHPCFCEYKAYKLPGVAQPSAAGTVASQTVALLRPSAHAQRLSSLAWENEAYVQLTWNIKRDSVALLQFLFPFRNATAAPWFLLIFWISPELFIWYLVLFLSPLVLVPYHCSVFVFLLLFHHWKGFQQTKDRTKECPFKPLKTKPV